MLRIGNVTWWINLGSIYGINYQLDTTFPGPFGTEHGNRTIACGHIKNPGVRGKFIDQCLPNLIKAKSRCTIVKATSA